ncbi:hypothetical protein D3C73_1547320 [compost metagenome]
MAHQGISSVLDAVLKRELCPEIVPYEVRQCLRWYAGHPGGAPGGFVRVDVHVDETRRDHETPSIGRLAPTADF